MNGSLVAKGVCAGYGPASVLSAVDLEVRTGEVVALMGANGAGKTTMLRTLAGYLRPTSGTITWLGKPARAAAHRRAREGLRYVSDTRTIVRRLTTLENLRLGFGDVDEALRLFPELVPLLRREVGLMSGGEQQMLALALALAGNPRLLLVDELSFGLAPQIVDRLLGAIRTAADSGLAVLLVEQHIHKALSIADRGYVMRRGAIDLQGTKFELLIRLDEIRTKYLGDIVK
jgi:branched-chain amino acid transport system ATP-binding protein